MSSGEAQNQKKESPEKRGRAVDHLARSMRRALHKQKNQIKLKQTKKSNEIQYNRGMFIIWQGTVLRAF
jgi:hypothetical protein